MAWLVLSRKKKKNQSLVHLIKTDLVRNLKLLSVNNLTKRFGGLVAVSSVDLEVKEKEIVSLIGPNGAGKTTLFAMVAGFLKADEGEINFEIQFSPNIAKFLPKSIFFRIVVTLCVRLRPRGQIIKRRAYIPNDFYYCRWSKWTSRYSRLLEISRRGRSRTRRFQAGFRIFGELGISGSDVLAKHAQRKWICVCPSKHVTGILRFFFGQRHATKQWSIRCVNVEGGVHFICEAVTLEVLFSLSQPVQERG